MDVNCTGTHTATHILLLPLQGESFAAIRPSKLQEFKQGRSIGGCISTPLDPRLAGISGGVEECWHVVGQLAGQTVPWQVRTVLPSQSPTLFCLGAKKKMKAHQGMSSLSSPANISNHEFSTNQNTSLFLCNLLFQLKNSSPGNNPRNP